MFYPKMRDLSVKKQHKGVSLLEMLIALFLGTFLLFSFSYFYSDIYRNHQKQKVLLDLQKNAHQIMHYLQQHILHMGYQGKMRENSNFDWFKFNSKPYRLEPNCLAFIQDLNSDGCLGKRGRQCTQQELNNTREVPKEIIAIKVENKALFIAGKQNKFNTCTRSQCRQWLANCQHFIWEKVAAFSDNQIEKLTFSWEKVPKLLKIELTLSALHFPNVQYAVTSYSYVLNGEE